MLGILVIENGVIILSADIFLEQILCGLVTFTRISKTTESWISYERCSHNVFLR